MLLKNATSWSSRGYHPRMTNLGRMWRANSSFDFIAKMVPTPSNYHPLCLYSQISIPAGVLKTHRLSLDVPEDDMGPNVPSIAPMSTSRIVVGPLVVKDLLEHFGGFRKNDPSLQWEFGASDVKVKTVIAGTKGTGTLLHGSALHC
jgi:hypothetical protein